MERVFEKNICVMLFFCLNALFFGSGIWYNKEQTLYI